ncbi:Wzz/FepE/Etk N-terminal domain-containing protein, partial [Escherichia coli]|nr:Wzz/FepE/Etk N-terminal domain-containing protein [Escherichia coli]
PLASPSNNEIDLLNLIEVLWRAKKKVIVGVFFFFFLRIIFSFFLSPKWVLAGGFHPYENLL